MLAPVIRLNDSPARWAKSGDLHLLDQERNDLRVGEGADDGDPHLPQLLDQPPEPGLGLARWQPAHGHLRGQLGESTTGLGDVLEADNGVPLRGTKGDHGSDPAKPDPAKPPVDKQSIPTAGLTPASPTALWAAGHRISPHPWSQGVKNRPGMAVGEESRPRPSMIRRHSSRSERVSDPRSRAEGHRSSNPLRHRK